MGTHESFDGFRSLESVNWTGRAVERLGTHEGFDGVCLLESIINWAC